MIDVELDIGLEWGSSGFGKDDVEKAVDAVIKCTALDALTNSPVPVSVSIKLSNNEEVHALNLEWRNKDKATNVLSFPMLDDAEWNALIEGTYIVPEIMLGDIILAHDICSLEASEKGTSIPHHATHLVVHGMLHLLGHDHIDDDEAEAMEALEVKALASIGVPNPYRA